MNKRWRELSDSPCVKLYGTKHKIAHFIGTASVFYCIGAQIDEGMRKGFTREDD